MNPIISVSSNEIECTVNFSLAHHLYLVSFKCAFSQVRESLNALRVENRLTEASDSLSNLMREVPFTVEDMNWIPQTSHKFPVYKYYLRV